jgi:hypothetical protein
MLAVVVVQEEQMALPQQAAQVAQAVVVRVTAMLMERLELQTQVAVAVVLVPLVLLVHQQLVVTVVLVQRLLYVVLL